MDTHPEKRRHEFADDLATFASGLDFASLPAPVLHEAKRRLIDSIGVAFAAWDCPPAVAAGSVAMRTSASPGATPFGSAVQSSPDLATLFNGILIRYLDYNDTYLSLEPAHPSDNIAAALAAAELAGSSGHDLLGAIVLGYEIQCRLCDAASIRARGWDHVVYGAMSTSLLAARLFALSPDQTRHALALGATPNVAIRQTRSGELSMWKGCAFANAARNGLLAAMLAAEGMSGPYDLFEGEFGVFRQVTGNFAPPPLGGDWMILRTYIKLYPVEYHAQSAVDSALRLRPRINGAGIEHVEIASFDAAVDIIGKDPEKWHPQSRETADHSLPYCVAVALLDGALTMRSFDDEHLHDPRVHDLLGRMSLVRDDALTSSYPEGIPNRLTITLAGGKTLSEQVAFPRGHAGNPMPDQELEGKFRSLIDQSPLAGRSQAILDLVWQMDREPNVARLFELLRLPEGR
jgi:2-methylcitrate dehydratase